MRASIADCRAGTASHAVRPRDDLAPIPESALAFTADRRGEAGLGDELARSLMGHAFDLFRGVEAAGPSAWRSNAVDVRGDDWHPPRREAGKAYRGSRWSR